MNDIQSWLQSDHLNFNVVNNYLNCIFYKRISNSIQRIKIPVADNVLTEESNFLSILKSSFKQFSQRTVRFMAILVTPGKNWLVSRRIDSVSCTREPLIATLVSNLRFTSYTLTAANVYDGGWAIENRHTKRERWISRRLLREVSQSLTKPDYSCLLHGWERPLILS